MKLQEIFESKQVGDLYHLVTLEKMKFILDNDLIKSRNFVSISLTRNKHMNDYLGSDGLVLFKLVLDGNKLSNNYKISPFSYISKTSIRFNEFEEIIKSNEIKNISKYIKQIIVIDKNLKDFRKLFPINEKEWDLFDIKQMNELNYVLKNLDKLGIVSYE